MRIKKVEWEKWGLFASLTLMICFSGVFFPKRELRTKEKEENSVAVDKTEALAPIAPTEDRESLTARKVAATRCGEKEIPKNLLTFPNPMLKSHVVQFEKESSSFLERSKLKTGVSIVIIQDLCPEPTVHFALHFPDKQLVSKPAPQAYEDYGRWVRDTFLELLGAKALTHGALMQWNQIEKQLTSESVQSYLAPIPADWGGVQITFRN